MPSGILYSVGKNAPDELEAYLLARQVHSQALLSRALLLAAENGYHECASLLIEAGTPPDTHAAGGYVPLHLAAKGGHSEVVKVLIKSNCNKERRVYKTFATALHWAAARNHVACMELLVDANCHIDSRTVYQQTPLMVAAINGEIEATGLLLKRGAEIDAVDSMKATALQLSVKEGHDDVTSELIATGADVNHCDKNHKTPLHEAARFGHVHLVRLLMEYGASVANIDAYGMTPLHYAAHFDSPGCLRVLIDDGSDLHAVTNPRKRVNPMPYLFDLYEENFVSGMTPLMLACQAGCIASVGILLSYPEIIATADVVDGYNMSALVYACLGGHGDCVCILLEKTNLDPNGPFTSKENHLNPLNLSIDNNQFKSVLSLVKANCSIFEDHVRKAIISGYLDVARLLILKMTQCISRDLLLAIRTDEPIGMIIPGIWEFLDWAEAYASPRSLLHLSRGAIRSCLGHHVLHACAVDYLPLPGQLKKYIMLSDLNNIF